MTRRFQQRHATHPPLSKIKIAYQGSGVNLALSRAMQGCCCKLVWGLTQQIIISNRATVQMHRQHLGHDQQLGHRASLDWLTIIDV